MSSSICWVGCWTWSVEHRACLKVVTIKNIPWGGVWPVAEMIRNLLIHNVTTQGCVMKSSVSLRTWLRTQSHIVELHNASFSSAGERLFKGSDCGPDSSIPSLCGWPWIQGLCKSDCSNTVSRMSLPASTGTLQYNSYRWPHLQQMRWMMIGWQAVCTWQSDGLIHQHGQLLQVRSIQRCHPV